MSSVNARIIEESDIGRWQDYVLNNPKACFYHSIEWKKIIEGYYGFKGFWLVAEEAEENSKIIGILPLFLSKSIFFGKALIPVPHATYGSICAGSKQAESSLIEKAKEIAKKEKVNYLELRQFEKLELDANMPVTAENFDFLLALDKNHDNIWKNKLQKEVRNLVRKAVKSGIEVRFDNSYLRQFYDVYAENMRDIGGLVHGYSYFEGLFKAFSGKAKLAVAFHSNKVVGGLVFFTFKNTAYNLFASTLRECFKFAPNYLLYWESIRYCCENNLEFFSFGRSQLNSGTYTFKKQWGAVPKQVYHYYHLNKSKKVPTISGAKGKLGIAISLYKKMPVFITKIIGPRLVRHVAL